MIRMIRNPVKAMVRKGELDKMIECAERQHKPRADLIRERTAIMTGIIAYWNRQDDKEKAA